MSNWIQTTFNVSGSVTQAIAVILALAVVLLLFGLFILILKRLTGAGIPQNRNRQPRIAVMDSAPVDTKRRLVLIRRDNIEHLILVGGPSDVVVEQNIIRNAPLTSPRQSPGPSSYTGAGLAGSGPIKSPMAPGPDIPVKPDDHMLDSEPETLAALAAPVRTPVIATEPEPEPEVSPVPPAAPGTPAAATAPVVPERPRTPPAPPRPSVQTRPAPATPPRAVRTERKSDTIDTGNETGRAADLLRAATQNGFNRAFARTPAPAPAPDTSAGAHRAPEVKSGQATSADHAAASTDKPSSEAPSYPPPTP
ncbi:flagellar biosynthetic protein FliO, partial [Labrenzia sp. 011]|uniref:flagellar biosynthetic protein FliO n=1 Tax=Labrenzia sp. 011 TaxID=2171494 RepID=UPI000D5106E4